MLAAVDAASILRECGSCDLDGGTTTAALEAQDSTPVCFDVKSVGASIFEKVRVRHGSTDELRR